MTKKTIAVDLDDVLSASAQGFVDFMNQQWGTNLSVENYNERWAILWGVDEKEEERRANIIHKSGVVRTFKQLKEAKEILIDIARHHKLVITTSRVRLVQEDTLAWLEQWYEGIFDEVHFAGFYDELSPQSHHQTKAELCKSVGADYLIDDHPKHCFAAAETGIQALLFGDYPWNREISVLPNGVTKVKNWQAVKAYFDGRS